MKELFIDIYKNHKGIFFFTFFVAIVSAGADIGSWLVQKNILDSLSNLQDFSVLLMLLLFLFMMYGLNQIFWALTFYFAQKYGSYVSQEYKRKALEKFHRIKYSLVLDKKEWEVHEVITNGVQSLSQVIDNFFGHVLQNSLMIIFWLGVLWYIDVYIFLYFTCVFIPVFVIYSIFGIKKRIPKSKELTDKRDVIWWQIIEYLSHIRDIKIFGVQHLFAKKFSKKMIGMFDLEMYIERSHHTMNFIQFFILMGSMCLVLLYTGFQILEGVFTIGVFLLVYHIFNSIRFALWGLVYMYRSFEESFIRIKKLIDFFQWEESEYHTDTFSWTFEKLDVQWLSFSYGTWKEILLNIDISLKKWEKIAIIGRSGQGKTTLVSILLGIYESYSGSILYNGKKWKWGVENLYSYVPQDTKLFNESIRFNLGLWEDFSDAVLRDMLEKVGLTYLSDRQEEHEDILDIHVGSSWLKLSGGERQRLGIARAMIRDYEIFVFDEITSNLDEETEQDILKLVFNIIGDRTCIIITHKKHALEKVDRVYEMRGGTLK